ncbi:MAG: FAD:protein FMN transferase [Candidatus Ratteibacteria bacterium]|nr:FAD:protein FMN transferase [Candidatus Ratteibacteria bacterium]
MKKIIILILVSLLLIGAGLHKRTHILMGTFVEITLTQQRDRLVDETAKKIQGWENELSVFKKGSDVKKLNSLEKDKTARVSDDVYEVIEKSIHYSKLTDGAFDITVSPLLKLWKFEGGKLKKTPSEEVIKKAMELVGWENVILVPKRKAVGFKKEGMSINLGGIAKGYIVDKAAEYLKKKGIKSALINAGGDIYCFGEKDDGELWNIGIQHPRKKKEIIGTLALTDKATATSGDYEKFVTLQGKKFSHIINPRTGYPVDNNIAQVTIVADTCIEADALATALMVMGKEKGLELIEKLPNTEAVIIEELQGKLEITYTTGLKESIKITEDQNANG